MKLLILFVLLLSIICNTYGSLVIEEAGDIPNKFPTPLNDKQKKDLTEAVSQLVYEKIYKNKQTKIADHGSIRIDMQGTFTSNGKKYHNLQAQINNVSGSSTVAHVNVDEELMSTKSNEQKNVQSKVRKAMLDSFKSGKTVNVFDKPKPTKAPKPKKGKSSTTTN